MHRKWIEKPENVINYAKYLHTSVQSGPLFCNRFKRTIKYAGIEEVSSFNRTASMLAYFFFSVLYSLFFCCCCCCFCVFRISVGRVTNSSEKTFKLVARFVHFSIFSSSSLLLLLLLLYVYNIDTTTVCRSAK